MTQKYLKQTIVFRNQEEYNNDIKAFEGYGWDVVNVEDVSPKNRIVTFKRKGKTIKGGIKEAVKKWFNKKFAAND